MQSRFFLPGIAPDVAPIAHAFAVRFLEPLVQFMFILVEPVAAKDISPRKRSRGRFPAMLQDYVVGKVDDDVSVPWSGERIGRFPHPRRAKDPIAVAQELNRGCAKGCPMARMLRVSTRTHQRFADQGGTSVLGVVIPGVRKVPRVVQGPCHSEVALYGLAQGLI